MGTEETKTAAGGILVVDKPAGWTSMDVCAKLRGLFRQKRVGHAGTLDPMATGVLPVFLGRATRAVEFASGSDKEYIAALRLGVVTNTQDVTGEVLEEREVSVTRSELEALLPRFTGELQQVPPMYSAIKVGGKKLYELARKGKEVERKPRKVTIHALELLDWPDGGEDVSLRVCCSKGTYVRTLCHDLGEALGCGGCMAALRRTRAAGFSLDDAHTMEEIEAAVERGAGESLLLPVDMLFAEKPALALTERQAERLRHGGRFSTAAPAGEYRAYAPAGEFLALCRVEDGVLSAIKSFFEV